MRLSRWLLLGAGALLAPGCLTELDRPAAPAVLDEPFFNCRVQPVLTRDCSALACHGDPRRYFRLYARNRLRWGGTEADRNELMRDSERAFDIASARAFVDATAPEKSLLLQKPLDQKSGGLYHGGAERYGQGDVYLTPSDSGYQVLFDWVTGSTEDPSCIEPGSDS